jgi:hypothetical protein
LRIQFLVREKQRLDVQVHDLVPSCLRELKSSLPHATPALLTRYRLSSCFENS